MLSFPSTLLSEVSKLYTPPSGHAAKGCRLYGPVFNRVGKETDASVQVLLAVVPDGTEVVDSHTADFVAMEENYLNRWTGFCVSYSSAFFIIIFFYSKLRMSKSYALLLLYCYTGTS